jgi:hypothetical protein
VKKLIARRRPSASAPGRRVAAKRALIRVCIAVGFASLTAQLVESRVIHHASHWEALGVIGPAVSIVCGLSYLRSTRGQR